MLDSSVNFKVICTPIYKYVLSDVLFIGGIVLILDGMSSKAQEIIFLKRLGLRLREIRIEKGWTLEQAEEKGYTSWRHLQKIEAGKNFNMITLYRLSQLYKMGLGEIFEGLNK